MLFLVALALFGWSRAHAQAASELPTLIEPVNDFAHAIDGQSAADMDRMIRALQRATGDVVVVATIPTVEPYADIREYAVKLFENRGRGIGEKGKDNGLLVLLALKERRVWVEVGYGLEPYITDGFAGETSREFMVPSFRDGEYGAGLRAGVARIIGRIAEARHVKLEEVPAPTPPSRHGGVPTGVFVVLGVILLVALLGGGLGGPGIGYRRWGSGPWSGWTSGVGPFGGGWGGSSGGGGFGGGFGGFGGGSSGGGGGGAGW